MSTMRDSRATIEDAQQAVAIKYGASSWERLVQACDLIDAIWDDDVEKIRQMVTAFPYLLHENAGIRNANWGPPLSYAANVGRDRIIEALVELGAKDQQCPSWRLTVSTEFLHRRSSSWWSRRQVR